MLDKQSSILANKGGVEVSGKALHCRDIIQDNCRLLVRLFGYWKGIKYIEINQDPLLVQG